LEWQKQKEEEVKEVKMKKKEKKKQKKKKQKKVKMMEIKRLVEEWKIWDKEEEIARSEEEAKKLVPE